MHYLGGKHRIGQSLSEFMLKALKSAGHPMGNYVEPFCGSGWVAKWMVPHFKQSLLSDAHEDLILMWKGFMEGVEFPNSISEEEYKRIKASPPSALRGLAGFGCSFSGKWLGGYARDNTKRNYYKNALNSNRKLAEVFKRHRVEFACSDYASLEIPRNSVVYCDPPYFGTTRYSQGKFDHGRFWETMRKWSQFSTVFISEYIAPDDFDLVWNRTRMQDMRDKTGQLPVRTERLFTFNLDWRNNVWTKRGD